MHTWAVLPVKPLKHIQTRLGEIREETLFTEKLEALWAIRDIDGILVISRDGKALNIARQYQAHTMRESGILELNDALERAAQFVISQGGRRMLVVSPYVQLVSIPEIERLLYLGRSQWTVVLAPDYNGDNVHAAVLNPPDYITLALGSGSFHKNLTAAREAEATVKTCHALELGHEQEVIASLRVCAYPA